MLIMRKTYNVFDFTRNFCTKQQNQTQVNLNYAKYPKGKHIHTVYLDNIKGYLFTN